ncbi:hypothetical protein BH11BAC5_BH11BAC5_41090 [soil metagenome]
MRLFILFIVCMAATLPSAQAQKKVDRQYFINLLNAGEYDKVFDSCTRLRKEVYGKNAVVDYFIAKSLCLDGYKDKSAYCFNCIIKNFKLSGAKKSFIQEEITTCTAPAAEEAATVAATPDFSYINNVSLPEASVGGKMGKVYDCYTQNQTMNLSSMVSASELESRLFSVNKKTASIKKIKSITDERYKIDTGGRYVFVTLKKYPLDSVSYAANQLEKAYRFFVSYYGLRAPDQLLTVYMLRDQQALRQTSKLVHGIVLPDPNIGYSNLSDLSLLGLGDAKHLGTMYHELFHLVVRTDLGDIPAFLDEGLASLYSVSKWQNDTLLGDYRPWRLDELQEAKYATDKQLQIPPMDKLINYSWDEFDGVETKNVCQVAVNYALSNFIMIYLQEKKLLQQMVTAFKSRPFVPDDPANVKTNLQIFESVVKDSIVNFTTKFDDWLSKLYNFSLYKKGAASIINTVSMQQQLDNAWALFYETQEKASLYIAADTLKKLQADLQTIERDYYAVGEKPGALNAASTAGNNTPMNAQANVMQQSAPVDEKTAKRNAVQQRLEAFDKKLRKLLFDHMPKTAN